MKFQERLKELRKEKGLTQRKLAEKLNYGYTAIANYESGRNQPKLQDLVRLADALDTSLDYLVGISDVRCDMTKYGPIEKKILKKAKQNNIELTIMDRLIVCFIYHMLKSNVLDKAQYDKLYNDKENMEKLLQEIEKECCVNFSERFYCFIRNEFIREAVISQI